MIVTGVPSSKLIWTLASSAIGGPTSAPFMTICAVWFDSGRIEPSTNCFVTTTVPVATGGALTVVSSLAVSLLAFGSDVSEETLTLFVIVPEVAAATVTVIVYCADPPEAISPSEQLATPLGSSPQPLVETKLTPAGSVSVTTTWSRPRDRR